MSENCGNTVLGQCFVFVETRDKANNDSSAAFTKRIEELGGRVANKLTDKVTHVVFKGGRKTTWDAATAKGIPLVSPMWVAAAETEEECADPSDHRAAMPQPSDAPQKSMEPVPVRHQEPPESSSQRFPETSRSLAGKAGTPAQLTSPKGTGKSTDKGTPGTHSDVSVTQEAVEDEEAAAQEEMPKSKDDLIAYLARHKYPQPSKLTLALLKKQAEACRESLSRTLEAGVQGGKGGKAGGEGGKGGQAGGKRRSSVLVAATPSGSEDEGDAAETDAEEAAEAGAAGAGAARRTKTTPEGALAGGASAAPGSERASRSKRQKTEQKSVAAELKPSKLGSKLGLKRGRGSGEGAACTSKAAAAQAEEAEEAEEADEEPTKGRASRKAATTPKLSAAKATAKAVAKPAAAKSAAAKPSAAKAAAKPSAAKAAAKPSAGGKRKVEEAEAEAEEAEESSPQSAADKHAHAPKHVAVSLSEDVGLRETVFAALAGLGGCKYDLAEGEIPADSVTHLVAASASKRTLKLLFAAARGIQVVSAEWVLRSYEARKWLPMQGKFVLRPAAEKGRALQGLRVFVASGNKLDRAQTERLVADAGGTALTNYTCKRAGRAHFSVGCVFTHEGVKKRDEDWLINSVLRGGVPPEDVPTPADVSEVSAEAKEEAKEAARDESDEDGGDGNSEEF